MFWLYRVEMACFCVPSANTPRLSFALRAVYRCIWWPKVVEAPCDLCVQYEGPNSKLLNFPLKKCACAVAQYVCLDSPVHAGSTAKGIMPHWQGDRG